MKDTLKGFLKRQSLFVNIVRRLKGGFYTKDMKGENNVLDIHPSSLFEHTRFVIRGSNNKIVIESGTVFRNVMFYISGNHNTVWIKQNTMFHKGGSLWIEDEYGSITIGSECSFEEASLAATEPYSTIHIGNDCLFANGIEVRTGDSHSILDAHTKSRINYAKNVVIEDHVWVGSHVSILKGARISKNSIVATRSVVTKSFDTDGLLIGGTPAVILKKDVTWDKKRL